MKYIVLTITLVVPVVAYLFLKNLGENKYAIPVYYQESSVGNEPSGCFQFSTPHVVDFTKYSGFTVNTSHSIMVVNPVFDSCFDCAPNLNELKRLRQKHGDIGILNLYVKELTSFENQLNDLSREWFINEITLPDMVSILRCELIVDIPSSTSITEMNEVNQLILIDDRNRIRGYYTKKEREDIDRLILEISILKQE